MPFTHEVFISQLVCCLPIIVMKSNTVNVAIKRLLVTSLPLMQGMYIPIMERGINPVRNSNGVKGVRFIENQRGQS